MTRISDITFKKLKAYEGDGSLVAIEGMDSVPIKIERVFYVYGVKNPDPRGNHAHRKCTQVLICVHGTCEVTCDDGMERRSFQLNHPTDMLIIPPGIWANEKYSTQDTVLMVLCDQHFDESDYIRKPEAFRVFQGLEPRIDGKGDGS